MMKETLAVAAFILVPIAIKVALVSYLTGLGIGGAIAIIALCMVLGF
jgi:hypothetical protein